MKNSKNIATGNKVIAKSDEILTVSSANCAAGLISPKRHSKKEFNMKKFLVITAGVLVLGFNGSAVAQTTSSAPSSSFLTPEMCFQLFSESLSASLLYSIYNACSPHMVPSAPTSETTGGGTTLVGSPLTRLPISAPTPGTSNNPDLQMEPGM